MADKMRTLEEQKSPPLIDIRRGFFTMCGIILCLCVMFLAFNATHLDTFMRFVSVQRMTSNPKFLIPLKSKLRSGLINDSSFFKTYLQTQTNYRKKLSSLASSKYKPSSHFIKYGEAVGKFIPSNSPKIKQILMWTPFFGNSDYIPRTMTCAGDSRCVSSKNRSDLLNSAAVVIHGRDIKKPSDLPAQRLPHQRWVYFIMESPYHTDLTISDFNNIFNWTATYRQDADCRAAYSTLHSLENPWTDTQHADNVSNIISSKSKLAASMVSNCQTPYSSRLGYLAELKRYMPLDQYGACGRLDCPRTERCDDIMKTYKFYLSLENSFCRDYITEKAANPLYKWNSVPVVMGGSDPREYDAILPPGSYIHTAGFDSPKHLAEYLLLLDRSPELYATYHEWRKNYRGVVYDYHAVWCKLCTKLYNLSAPVQTYTHFDGWYKEDKCKP